MTYYRVNWDMDGKLYCKSDNIQLVIKYAQLIDKDAKVTKINFVPRSAYVLENKEK